MRDPQDFECDCCGGSGLLCDCCGILDPDCGRCAEGHCECAVKAWQRPNADAIYAAYFGDEVGS